MERKYRWLADMKTLPGSPPIGYGKTAAEAVGNLMLGIAADKRTWDKYFADPLVIEETVEDD